MYYDVYFICLFCLFCVKGGIGKVKLVELSLDSPDGKRWENKRESKLFVAEMVVNKVMNQ